MNQIPELRKILQDDIQSGNHLKIMTSYFTLFAYKEIQTKLSKVERIDLIVNPNKYHHSGRYIKIRASALKRINQSEKDKTTNEST